MARILIVEDEMPIASLLQTLLAAQGHACETAGDGHAAADILEQQDFDLVLLDIMLPGIDGYELFEYAQQIGMPVIFLTAKADLGDKVKGLRMGAQDYITKPFEPEELLARVDNALRRTGNAPGALHAWGATLDADKRTVMRDGKPIPLTPREFDLLEALMRNKGATLYREYLYDTVWGEVDEGMTRTLDTHIQRLRGKLGWKDEIKTVYKTGYRLEDDT